MVSTDSRFCARRRPRRLLLENCSSQNCSHSMYAFGISIYNSWMEAHHHAQSPCHCSRPCPVAFDSMKVRRLRGPPPAASPPEQQIVRTDSQACGLHNKSRISSWVQLCGDLNCLLLLYEAISIVVNEIEYLPLAQLMNDRKPDGRSQEV